MMFGTAGIRGNYGDEITDELIRRISNHFAKGSVAVGRDIRKSGIHLRKAVSSGVNDAGYDVFDLGIATTPTVALASKKYGQGIMITASHNPIEHNGIKPMVNGREITAEEGKIFFEGENEQNERKSAKSGAIICDETIFEQHVQMVLKMVRPELSAKKPLKVVADCNGAAYSITPRVLTDLGCKVISLNCSDSEFFRPSEPKKENLESLSAAVRAVGADMGIAHDADGDRCIILDKNGEQIPMDVQLAMMIEEEMGSSSNKKITATVEASLLIRETVERLGGKLTITPVGSTYLAVELEKQGALFAGEPCGEYIYAAATHVPDGVLTAAKFIELASKKDIISLWRKYSHSPMARDKFPTKDRTAAMERIKKEIARSYDFSQLDGIRVDEDDGWFLVRPSGTEKLIRLTMEYKDKKKLEEKKKEIEYIIKKAV